jgi:hypothetical protein
MKNVLENNADNSIRFEDILTNPMLKMSYLTKSKMLQTNKDILIRDPDDDYISVSAQSNKSKDTLSQLEQDNSQNKTMQYAERKIGNTNKRRGHGRGCV